MLENINRARLDPQGELGVLLLSTAPLLSSDANIQAALDFFEVDSATLLDQWEGLEPVAPLAWNSALDAAAAAHTQGMIERDQQLHDLPGEPNLGQRVRDAGYAWSIVAENICAYAESTLHAHAAFVIDGGQTATGMQDPPATARPSWTVASVKSRSACCPTTTRPPRWVRWSSLKTAVSCTALATSSVGTLGPPSTRRSILRQELPPRN